ncbi:hypothetical protein DVH05_007160 [Phytophthora capsici]|nr:hypothetical protein DVH05_007160 [Phytophthora capsici]
MKRRQQRLYEQRRHQMSDSKLTAARNELRNQWAIRRVVTTRVDAWWNDDDAGDETEQAITRWNTNSIWQETSDSGRPEIVISGQRGTDDHGVDGSQLSSTNGSTAPGGSWKTLGERKSCNGAHRTATGEASPGIEVSSGDLPWKLEDPGKTTPEQLISDLRSPRQAEPGDRRGLRISSGRAEAGLT